MSQNDGFALLTGVDDFNALDRSTGRAESTSSRAGGVPDFPETSALQAKAAFSSRKKSGGIIANEIDAGTRDWKKYAISYIDAGGEHEFLRSYTIKNAQEGFTAGYEYWYVKTALAIPRKLTTNDITFSSTEGDGVPAGTGWSPQTTFEVLDNIAWGAGRMTDADAGEGLLYVKGTLAFRLVFNAAGSKITSIVWYRVESSAPTGHITPNGTFVFTAGGAVIAPAGSLIYSITDTTGF